MERPGPRVSAIGLGTMLRAGHFGAMHDEKSRAAADAALALGVKLIDTFERTLQIAESIEA